jgi:branched-chain amino acid transport system ATP-binding protein
MPTDMVMELRNASVAYHGDIRILQGLSLAVRTGKITGIIGPNGAGKSTALKSLYGLLRLVEGDVLIAAWHWFRRTVACSTSCRSRTICG